uniref:Uncharacterized protein n=1 Tax=Hyaloperonospora arabidopsidis (strain Emoy2) TaxID=559515 RepID=M4BX96_HYAAE
MRTLQHLNDGSERHLHEVMDYLHQALQLASDFQLHATTTFQICQPLWCMVSVTGHRSNTLDNQCGATITDSSASGVSINLANVQRKVNN